MTASPPLFDVVRRLRAGAARALVLALLAACNKEPPVKPALDAPKKTTEVTGEAAGFNDFLPSSGAATLAVKVDGGLLEAGSGVGAGAVAGGGAAPAAGSRLRVVEPGAEPRAVRKYAFTANKTERRTLTIRQSMQQGPKRQDQPALAVTADFVAKDVKPSGTRFEMKVAKVELAEKDKLPPQMAAAFEKEVSGFAGLVATFEVSPLGQVGELSIGGDKKMAREGAAELLELFSQVAELVVAPLPEEAIGVGAKWESLEEQDERGAKITSKRSLELKDATAEGATVFSTIEKHVPKRVVQESPRGVVTAEVHATGSYTFVIRFDRLATKATGEQTTLINNEIASAEGPKQQSQKIVQEVKVKHVLETPSK
jgi:hypothetical protein